MRLILTLVLAASGALAAPYGLEYRAEVEATLDLPGCKGGQLPAPWRLPTKADADWDVTHVDLYLYPHFDSETLEGSAQFYCESRLEGLSEVRLDFRDEMSVDHVELLGLPASYTHAGHEIVIAIDPPLALDQYFHILVEFSGEPVSLGWGSFVWGQHEGVDLVATLSEPEGARGWWPCKDVPDDKFTADLRYRVPKGFKAPGMGLLQSVHDHGDGTEEWHWREDYPINTYLIAMTITNYDMWTDWYVRTPGDSLPIENYVWPELWEGAQEDLSITGEAMAMLEERFGIYPFDEEKYGHAVFTWGGAMEHQTMTSYGYMLLGGTHYYDRILVHELMHQWFGNCVTLADWENVWLNEGFASYSEALWFEHRDGPSGLTWWMENLAEIDYEGSVYNNPDLFGDEVYRKGAWVLHMLRWLVNDDDTYFAALRDYLGRHAYGNAHTTELQADLEDFLGRDLETFFQQWVYGVERPRYEWSWWTSGGGIDDTTLMIRVDQVQTDTGLFEMPLPFVVDTMAGPVAIRLDNDRWSQVFSVPLGFTTVSDLHFDPDCWVLKHETEVQADPTGVGEAPVFATEIHGNFPNPFNPRTQILFSLAERGPVSLKIYDASGRHVATVAEGTLDAGHHALTWDGVGSRGQEMPSGVYLARLATSDGAATHRMILMK